MIFQKEYDGKCWWCGAIADSSEHRYKSSDLKREYGKGFQFKNIEPIRVLDNTEHLAIERPKSKTVKFKKSICKNCNTTRSQPFDLAYDKFNDFYKLNEDLICNQGSIDLILIFGENWQNDLLNLQKYYVKHFCCRLYEAGAFISNDMIQFLNDESGLLNLKLIILLRSDIQKLLEFSSTIDKSSYMGMDGLTGNMSVSKNAYHFLETTFSYRALTIHFYYSLESNRFTTNLSTGPVIYLPKYVNPEFNKLVEDQLNDRKA